MSLSTNNITELKDQLFFATESGDLAEVKQILELFPQLIDEKVNEMNVYKFAARHGHSHILKYLSVKEDKDFIMDLIKDAGIDGHIETIALLVNSMSALFDYKNLNSEVYYEIKKLVPSSCTKAVYFPYNWNKLKGLLFLCKKGKLPPLPVKKLAKFLY
jgi:hypothetical protein